MLPNELLKDHFFEPEDSVFPCWGLQTLVDRAAAIFACMTVPLFRVELKISQELPRFKGAPGAVKVLNISKHTVFA